MKKTINLFLSVLYSVLLLSCNSSEKFLDDFESFIVDIEEGSESYSSKDWNRTSETYEDFIESFESYRGEMDEDQLREFGRLNARYLKSVVAGKIKSLNEMIPVLDGYSEELLDDVGINDLISQIEDDNDNLE